ncbi:hypothetical protein GCM10027299_24040 [Larkinella ripae]
MGQKPRILIADDDPAYRRLITYHLTLNGYEVSIAHHGRQVLDWLGVAHNRPQLLVLDLLMPQLSGIEVMERVKLLPYKLPVILVSGAEWAIAREAVNQANPDAFLVKPFNLQTLLDTIQSLLQPLLTDNEEAPHNAGLD